MCSWDVALSSVPWQTPLSPQRQLRLHKVKILAHGVILQKPKLFVHNVDFWVKVDSDQMSAPGRLHLI